jgi:hypothetical protein
MGFFKRKEAPLKKDTVENPKKGISTLESIIHERVITAAGFTRRALSKLKKSK